MAIKVTKAKQIGFSLPNKVGLMAEVAEALAAAKVNIEAICAYEMEDEGYFMLVTDDTAKAKKALSKLSKEIITDDVFYVEVPNKPGQLGAVSRKLSKRVLMFSISTAAPEQAGPPCLSSKQTTTARQ